MSWETALRARLLNDAAVAGIVGTRINWTLRPQTEAYPSIVLTTVSDVRDQHFEAFQGFRASRVQFDCYCLTRAAVAPLREAVIAAIEDAGTFSGVRFGQVAQVTVRDLSADTDTGFVHRDSIDAQIWHD